MFNFSHKMSRIKWTFPLIKDRRKSNYIENPKIATKIAKRKITQQKRQAIKGSEGTIGHKKKS